MSRVYNQFAAERNQVEDLSLDDEVVGSQFWNRRSAVETAMLDIIQAWFDKRIGAAEALEQLKLNDLLDPNDQMLGLAAVMSARMPAPPARSIAQPPLEYLETLATARRR